ncbi:MAG TPA: TonB-dependent receptor [Vicinamibacterales bacterium]|nr:TonB-dependent receptor [Vicinamibacterales bacterium]
MRTALVFVLVLGVSTAARAGVDRTSEDPALGAEAPNAAAQVTLSGIIKDEAGGAVSGATVLVVGSSGSEQQTVSGPDGRFTLTMPPTGDLTLVVRAGGFAEWTQSVPANREIDVVLHIASLFETVTVTPTRSAKRLGDVPVSANIVERETIRQSPAVVADDVLRQVPTFSLFRRSSSLSSHPTAQGVSLRGLGPSGVSRTLVLVDGVPFNDPFGGWVYWTRVPLESVNRIEVIDSSSSSLYGNYGMGGVINIISASPARRSVEFKTQYGNHNSPKADFFASDVWGKLGVAVEGGAFDTDGFPIVIANERGLIDNNAQVNFKNFNVKTDYRANDRVSLFFRGGYFKENRVNGKVGEVNDTKWTAAGGGVRVRMPDESDLQATVFSDDNTFHSTFLAVTAPSATVASRSIVRLATDQTVPTDAFGTMIQWSRAVGRNNFFSAGFDWRRVDGDSLEDLYVAAPGVPIVPPTQQAVLNGRRNSGGTQRSAGLFLQDVFSMNDFVLTLSARVDSWKNYDGHITETSVATGLPTAGNRGDLADKDDTIVSPRAAALYRLSARVSVWGDIGWGFRAPTLNELYRQFSVGLTRTLANETLGPERLFGGEAGVRLEATRTVSIRSTYYDNGVKNPVANVTIGTNLQQRQNLGRTRIRGWQNDVETRVGQYLRVSAGYLFNNAKVTEYNPVPVPGVTVVDLTGLYLPQVPKHRGTVSVAYANPRVVNVAVAGSFYGRQFDDDQNARIKPGETEPGLPAYGLLDLSASRDVGRNLQVFFGVQNVFDQEYYVQLLPTTIGSPRLVNGGVRVRWAGQ